MVNTNTCTNSQKINSQCSLLLLSAATITPQTYCVSLRPYQLCSVQMSTDSRRKQKALLELRMATYVGLGASPELLLLRLSTSLLCGCYFFVRRGEALTSNRLLCFKTPRLHCSSSMNSSTCPSCWEQQ